MSRSPSVRLLLSLTVASLGVVVMGTMAVQQLLQGQAGGGDGPSDCVDNECPGSSVSSSNVIQCTYTDGNWHYGWEPNPPPGRCTYCVCLPGGSLRCDGNAGFGGECCVHLGYDGSNGPDGLCYYNFSSAAASSSTQSSSEQSSSAAASSASGGYCGDGTCDLNGSNHENCQSCYLDCSWTCPRSSSSSDVPFSFCGDGMCSASETCSLCSADCGECASSSRSSSSRNSSASSDTWSSSRNSSSAPTCGDNICSPGETCSSCASDCSAQCQSSSSSASSCPALLPPAPPASCSYDCAHATYGSDGCMVSCPLVCSSSSRGQMCGDGICSPSAGESCSTCVSDCSNLCICGDGICSTAAGESCTTCTSDCSPICHGSSSSAAVCGDGICSVNGGETCSSCLTDCGMTCTDTTGECAGAPVLNHPAPACAQPRWTGDLSCHSSMCLAGLQTCDVKVQNDSIGCNTDFYARLRWTTTGSGNSVVQSYDDSLYIDDIRDPAHTVPALSTQVPSDIARWTHDLQTAHFASGSVLLKRNGNANDVNLTVCAYVKVYDKNGQNPQSIWIPSTSPLLHPPQTFIKDDSYHTAAADPTAPICALTLEKSASCVPGGYRYHIKGHAKDATFIVVADGMADMRQCVDSITDLSDPVHCRVGTAGASGIACTFDHQSDTAEVAFTVIPKNTPACQSLRNQSVVLMDTDSGDTAGYHEFRTNTLVLSLPVQCAAGTCPANQFCSVKVENGSCNYKACLPNQVMQCAGTCGTTIGSSNCFGTCCTCVTPGSSSSAPVCTTQSPAPGCNYDCSARNQLGCCVLRCNASSSSRSSAPSIAVAPNCGGTECKDIGNQLCAADGRSCTQKTAYPCMACGGFLTSSRGNGSSNSAPYDIVLGGSPLCGDGELNAGEECDDGNNVSGDGCTNVCTGEGPPLHASPNGCGNKRLEDGEQCDDGNTLSGDGCSKSCQREAGMPPQSVANLPAIDIQYCGNSRLDPGEQCDDGNTLSGDGCSAACWGEVLGDYGTWLPADIGSKPLGVTQQATLIDITTNHAPAGKTGPATVVFMAAGAAGGLAWMRRRRTSDR